MDPFSVRMVRASLVWLVGGFSLGALMLSDALVPGSWRVWFAPTHGHILFVSWFLQFALGVGYWLRPRKRSPERPLGYQESIAFVGFVCLNLGLLLRSVGEPAGRINDGGRVIDLVLAASSILQLLAIIIFAWQLWGRIRPRQKQQRPNGSEIS